MLIGCCGNCRYTDLLRDILDTCPRCGARMVSLGVDSIDWNDLDAEGRQEIIDRTLPPDSPEGAEPPIPDTFWELYPKREPKIKPGHEEVTVQITEPDNGQEEKNETEAVNEQDPYPGPNGDFTPRYEAVRFEELVGIPRPVFEPEPSEEPEIIPAGDVAEDPDPEQGEPGIMDIRIPTEQIKETAAIPDPESEVEEKQDREVADNTDHTDHTGNSGYVYVCYRCNSIAGRDGICPECGSDMIQVGYTAREWSFLSKQEKRQAAEDAKIRHMVSAIMEAPIDDSESVQSIINVVKATE